MRKNRLFLALTVLVGLAGWQSVGAEELKVGLNYPSTGPYKEIGLDQMRATEMAMEEINANGGVNGRPLVLLTKDTQSKPDVSVANVKELVAAGAEMIFGGASSGVAVAVGEECQKQGKLFMGTVAASNEVTEEKGHRNTVRVCFNARMGAKALATYLNETAPNKKYLYITANYTWGWSAEKSLREYTKTEDTNIHKGLKTPFPKAMDEDFQKALRMAKIIKPDVLVLVLFGEDMTKAIRMASTLGLQETCKIVVPILELSMAEKAGPKVMEGVVGASDWNWQVPNKIDSKKGKEFVEKFKTKYKRYPCWGAATAYTNLYEYKSAVERAGSVDTAKVIKALEGHSFTLLKDEQQWRSFDHQCVQSVYVVKCKPVSEVSKDPIKQDYFEILKRVPGAEVMNSRQDWVNVRTKAGVPASLESLPGE